MMQLFTYYRSSASYRVRIALNLKQLSAIHVPVNLLNMEQQTSEYTRYNPQQLVPTLFTEEGIALTQSLAIMEYLEERYPAAPLLPLSTEERARVRALAQVIACEMAPVYNLRVRNYLQQELGLDEEQGLSWGRHWMTLGFRAVEVMLEQPQTGQYCHGDQPGLADCCLVPQVFNARRIECDMDPFPNIRRIVEACERLPAFAKAHPSQQDDATGV